MKFKTTLIFFIVLLTIIFLFCLKRGSKQIEKNLAGSVTAQLQAQGLTSVSVAANGRDVILQGILPAESLKTKAGKICSATPGVRKLVNHIQVAVPLKARSSSVSGFAKMLREATLYFGPGQWSISAGDRVLLDWLADSLKHHPGVRLEICGFSDSSGTETINKQLSQKRAQAAVDSLLKRGIPSNRLLPKGFGSREPRASNKSKRGRQKNRRVEFRLSEKF
ncbi:MAG: OmpA family protein [Nitrospiraceae bacterium]|nr:OmpA family protein [Nitrospiraceae bacterium]